MNPVEEMLRKFPMIILDGAMATELEHYGCDLNDPLWSAKVLMESPELIKRVHSDYFTSGADCAITASYQATVEGFMRRGLSEEKALELIRTSVQIALQARDEFWELAGKPSSRPKPIVAASVGPYGAFLADGSEYRGDYRVSEAELIEFHRPRMRALIEAGADILACETIPCLMEAKAIVKLLEQSPGTYAWISFSGKDEMNISNGESIADCATWLDEYEQVAAIGINCTSPQYVPSLIREIRGRTTKPIIVYPNTGEQYDADAKCWTGHSEEESFGTSAREWYASGARLIGGCCRSTPDDIKAVAAWGRNP